MRRCAALIGTALIPLAFGACGTSNSTATTATAAVSTTATPHTTAPTTTASTSTSSSTTTSTPTAIQVKIQSEDPYLASRLVEVPGYEYLDLPDDLRQQLEAEINNGARELQDQEGIMPIERVSGHMITTGGSAIGALALVELTDQWKALANATINSLLSSFGTGPCADASNIDSAAGTSPCPDASTIDIAGTKVAATTTADEADYAWLNDGVLHFFAGEPSMSTRTFVEGFIKASTARGSATSTTTG